MFNLLFSIKKYIIKIYEQNIKLSFYKYINITQAERRVPTSLFHF